MINHNTPATKTGSLLIRNATLEDASFVARCLLAAMEIVEMEDNSKASDEFLRSVTNSCQKEDELYSYKRAKIAELDGRVAGCLISYDGEGYEQLRKTTFERLLRENGLDLTKNPLETGPGEYYLDCMAILPEYRGKGIGLQLMKDGIELAKRKNIHRVTLLVDRSHPRLKSYYCQLGFSPMCEMAAFDSEYIKMKLDI